jgi:hypothetical protein
LGNSRPLGFRQELLQVLFDQIRIVGSGQAQSLRHALHMGIDHDAWPAEGSPEYDIRGLSSDTRQGDQLFHRVRDLLAEAFGHSFAAGDEMFRLVLEKAGGTNDLFEFRKMSRSQLCRLPIPTKERWSDLVDSLVGTLGGEDRGHEQLPRGTMIKFHLRARHRALEQLRNLSKTLSMIR